MLNIDTHNLKVAIAEGKVSPCFQIEAFQEIIENLNGQDVGDVTDTASDMFEQYFDPLSSGKSVSIAHFVRQEKLLKADARNEAPSVRLMVMAMIDGTMDSLERLYPGFKRQNAAIQRFEVFGRRFPVASEPEQEF